MRSSLGPTGIAALAAGLALLALGTDGSVAQSGRSVERVTVDLILVDVEARDADGRPMRGLKAGDFDVLLDGVRRTLYSLDDHCGCSEGGPTVAAESGLRTPDAEGTGRIGMPATDAAAAGSAPPLPATVAPEEPDVWVLYFDSSFMDVGGRQIAIREAERWIRETMRDGDQVMVVSSAFNSGAVVVREPTTIRAELLSALEGMKEDLSLLDPHMPFLPARRRECERDHEWRVISLPSCNGNAITEQVHGRAALRTLASFTESLEGIPGTKSLIYFHEIAPYEPANLYAGARSRGTQEAAVTAAAAAAVASRVTVHAAATADPQQVGQMLAEYTGGTWNKGSSTLSRTLDAARNRCVCLYRLGIEPAAGSVGRVHEVLVKAKGRSIANLRVRSYDSSDRWMRKARGVLARPGGAVDLPVAASIEPVRSGKGTWDAKIVVAFRGDALALLPAGPKGVAEWECGALLVLDDARKSWELLGVNSMSAPPGAPPPEWFVHEQVIRDLPPGKYRLGAFVRDRTVDLFGGASAALVLPDPSGPGIAGPVVHLAGRRVIASDLPLQPAAQAASTRARLEPSRAVPAAERSGTQATGPPYEIRSWICGNAAGAGLPAGLDRYLSFEDAVVMSYDEAEGAVAPAGDCLRLTDQIEAGLLDDAPYRYHLRFRPKGGGTIEAEAALP